MKILLYLILTHQILTQFDMPDLGGVGDAGSGGGTSNISITPPPTPQEILPPKPIIIAPILVKQHHRSSKLAVIHSGPPQSPWGMDTPGYNGGVPYMDGSRKLNGRPNPYSMYTHMMQNQMMNYPRATTSGDYLNINRNPRNLNVSQQQNSNFGTNRNLMQNIIMQNSRQDMPDLTNNIKMEGDRNDLTMIPETSELQNDEVSRESIRYIHTIHIMNDLKNNSIGACWGVRAEVGY